MSVRPSKGALARAQAKTDRDSLGSTTKQPRFSHNHLIAKDKFAKTLALATIVLAPPSVVDLEGTVDSAPTFEESIQDLP